MSFKAFKEDLLVALAIVAEAKATEQFEAIEITRQRDITYRDGWLRQAVKLLEDNGDIRVTRYLGGGEDLGMKISLTGPGIEHAEEICGERASNLYEEIEENKIQANPTSDPTSLDIPASDRVVKIDHNLPEYREIVEKIDSVTFTAKTNNLLKSDYPEESEQRVAELEAGRRLLDAPQANPRLIKELLINALKWFAEKIADGVVSTMIATLMLIIAKFLGFG